MSSSSDKDVKVPGLSKPMPTSSAPVERSISASQALLGDNPEQFSLADFLDAEIGVDNVESLDAWKACEDHLDQLHRDALNQQEALLLEHVENRKKYQQEAQTIVGKMRQLEALHAAEHKALSKHISASEPVHQAVRDARRKMGVVDRVTEYLSQVDQVEAMSQEAKAKMDTAPVEAVKLLLQLVEKHRHTLEAGCVGLHKQLHVRCTYLREGLESKLRELCKAGLKAMGWPKTRRTQLTTEASVVNPVLLAMQSLLELQLAAVDLAAVDSSSASTTSTDSKSPANASSPTSPGASATSLWITQLLLHPVHLRFRYHFTGDRKTNQLNKPEWYLAFVLAAIEDHIAFIDSRIQPIVDAHAQHRLLRGYSVKREFIQGLVTLVRAKLRSSLASLKASPTVYRHTVNEILVFETKLRAFLDLESPEALASIREEDGVVLQCFTESPSELDNWIKIEWFFAKSRLHDITKDDKTVNWKAVPEETPDNSGGQPRNKLSNLVPTTDIVHTSSGAQFISLLKGVTSRYRLLPRLSHRLRFVEDIQLRILQKYTETLGSKFKSSWSSLSEHAAGSSQDVQDLWSTCCGLMDCVQYCQRVLEDCGNGLLFVELQYIRVKRQEAKEAAAKNSDDEKEEVKDASSPSHGHHDAPSETDGFDWVTATSQDVMSQPDFVDVTGSVFDDAVGELQALEAEMSRKMVDLVVHCFMNTTREYRSRGFMERAGGVAGDEDSDIAASRGYGSDEDAGGDAAPVDLTPEFCRPLSVLKFQLLLLGRYLSVSLHSEVWRAVASKLNKQVYRTIVSEKYFSVPGIQRFAFDMRTLFVLFKPYTNAPENFFKHVKEALVLLELDSVKLLELRNVLRGTDTKRCRLLLEQYQVRVFSVTDVRRLLGRIHLPGQPDVDPSPPLHDEKTTTMVEDDDDEEEEEEDKNDAADGATRVDKYATTAHVSPTPSPSSAAEDSEEWDDWD